MSLNNSPSFESLSTGTEDAPKWGKRRIWILIAVLFVVVLILGAVNLLQSDVGKGLLGNGSISGRVVDGNGDVLQEAEAFIEGGNISTFTDANGRFLLENVPSGEHNLVVGYQGVGVQKIVAVNAGVVLDTGTISIEVPEVPWAE